MKARLGLAAVLLLAASATDAVPTLATYNFSYDTGFGYFTGQLSGHLQGDNNTVSRMAPPLSKRLGLVGAVMRQHRTAIVV